MNTDNYINWIDILSQIEGMPEVTAEEVDEIVGGFLLKDKIDSYSFLSNYISLSVGRDLTNEEKSQMDPEMASHFKPTPSIKRLWNHPLMESCVTFAAEYPIWFVIGYPDVVLWFYTMNRPENRNKQIDRLNKQIFTPRGRGNPAFLTRLVATYSESTKSKLETSRKRRLFGL